MATADFVMDRPKNSEEPKRELTLEEASSPEFLDAITAAFAAAAKDAVAELHAKGLPAYVRRDGRFLKILPSGEEVP